MAREPDVGRACDVRENLFGRRRDQRPAAEVAVHAHDQERPWLVLHEVIERVDVYVGEVLRTRAQHSLSVKSGAGTPAIGPYGVSMRIGMSEYVTSRVQRKPALASSPFVSGVNASTGLAQPVTFFVATASSMSMLFRIGAVWFIERPP